jgi:alginate O-acetyltransferase complex protein AlgI
MLFHTLDFAIFLPVVFLIYWFVFKKNLQAQNLFIVVASYLFYGWWDWRFLFLLFLSSGVDFSMGIFIGRAETPARKKALLATSLLLNLGLLGYFKYYNFFIDSFADAFTFFGYPMSPSHLTIVLPVGISFYTFQSISYCIDVYRGHLKPTTNPISYFAYVSFFPQLVAGPIERAITLLPQFYKPRTFNYTLAVDGLRQILWGLFKKVVIADSCAIYANEIFNNYESYPGSVLFMGAVFFAFQIYGDFSGYSDIAIGTARLFGFSLMRNFAFPYFSRDIAEFWRRWHISLSTWFRDYLYIPLGGSRGGSAMRVRNTFVIFLASGFWHGANWTFLAWGALHAIYFLPLLLLGRNRENLNIAAAGKTWPSIREAFGMLTTFLLVTLAWIFFRAATMEEALFFLKEIFSSSFFTKPDLAVRAYITLGWVLVLLVMEWQGRENQYGIERWGLNWSRPYRWSAYLMIAAVIFAYAGGKQQFIYFQF